MYKLLLVEDNHLLANTIKEIFEPSLYQISYACEGSNGYRLARNYQFDLIIMDIILPGRNGLKIVEQLRFNDIDTPVLVISTKNTLQDIIEGYEYLIDGYLPKPFSIYELKARIKGMLRRPAHKIANIIKFGDLTVDTNNCSVVRGSESINLRKKEYEILLYMLKNPDKLITRDQLGNNIWDMNSEPYRGTIDVHISNLRQKIDNGSKIKIIKTVHGFGYKLNNTVNSLCEA